MAQVLDDADFWLPPPHCLAREAPHSAVCGNLAFPKQVLPYDFDLFESELSSPVPESEDDDFFSDLNRCLAFSESRKVAPLDLRQPSEAPKVFRGSPQSILGGIGSWSGRSSNESHQSPLQGPSPPATPYEAEYDTAGLIYAAAGQVERLKIITEGPFSTNLNGQSRMVSNTKLELSPLLPPLQKHKASDVLAQQNYLAAARRAYNAALLYEHHLQSITNSTRHAKSGSGQFTQSPWPSTQHRQSMLPTKATFQSAPLQRKESVGTGVFLPRTYNTAPAAPPRKRNVAATAVEPAKVVQALNMSSEEMNSRSQPHYSAYAASMSQKNYEALMVRRNVFIAQQQRRVARADDISQSNHEVCLPQEWSY